MTKLIGRRVSVGIAKESVRGTPVASTNWVPWMDATIETRVERALNESSLGNIYDSDDSKIVNKWGEGTLKGKMKDETFGLFLLSLLGTDTPSLVEAGVYDHLFSVEQTNQHQSLTIAVKDDNVDEAYANAVIDSIKLDVELGNYVMFEAAFMAKSEIAAANTVVNTVERDFVPQMFEFKKAANQAGLDAAPATSIKNLSIELRSNVMREPILGSVEPNDILNQTFVIEGAVTLTHDNTDFEDLQNDDTDQALRFKLVHTDTIGAASMPTLTIDLYKAKISDYERSLTQNEIVEESFNFKAHFSLVDGKMVDVTLRNEVAAY